MFPTNISAHVYMMGMPKCYNPRCVNILVDFSQAIFLCGAHGSTGFCCFDCMVETVGQFLAQKRASRSAFDQDQLAKLGYGGPDGDVPQE